MANQRQRNPKDSHRQIHGDGQHTQRIGRLFQRIRELGLDKRGETEKDLEWVLRDSSDISFIQLLEERVAEEEEQLALHPDPFRANAAWDGEHLGGPLNLGRILQTGFQYGIPPDQLCRHFGVFGRIRGGKTNLQLVLYAELKRKFPEVRLTLLESKQEFTDVASEFAFNIICSSDLRINPLRPPEGIPAHVWLSHLTQTMVNFLDIRVASSSLILDMAITLLDEAGFSSNPEASCPHLGDLLKLIAGQKFPAYSHNARYQETTCNRLQALLNSCPGMFECDKGLSFPDLINDDYLILLEDVPYADIQNFLKVYIASGLFLYRMIVEGQQPHLTNIVGLDEATPLFRRTDEVKDKASYLSTVVSQSPAFGIGIVAASQYATDLSHALLGNTATKVLVGGFERDDDIRVLLGSRPHTREQADLVRSTRQPGRAFISDLRHTHFIECQIDQPELPAPMTREEVKEASRATALALGFIAPPCAPASGHLDEFLETDSVGGTADKIEHKPKPRDDETEEDRDLRILRDVESSTCEVYSSRAKRLNISGSGLKTVITRLEAQGKIKIYPVHDRPGRPRDLYEVTEDGYGVLGMGKPAMKGKGGYLHQFYQARASEYLQAQGYRVKIEGRADAKEVDIVAVKEPEGETVAVEIELNAKTSTHFLENARMDLKSSRIDRVLFLVPTKPEREVVEKAVGADSELSAQRTHIEVDYIRNYMDLKS